MLLGLFVSLQAVLPNVPGMIHEGVLMDQYLAVEILDLLKQNSFWELLMEGRLPAQRDPQPYHGTLMAYLYLPFLKLFGRNWYAAKYWPTLFAVLTMLFSYGFMRNLFGRRAAILSLLFLTIHPPFVIGTRIGGIWLNHMQVFSTGSLFFLERWWSTRRNAFLAAGMLMTALGLSTQLWFYWFVVALAAAFFVFARDIRSAFGSFSRRNARRSAAWAAGGLFVGAVPLIYRELVHRFASAEAALAHLLSPGNPYSAFHYLSRLPDVFIRIGEFLSGRHAFDFLFAFEPSYLVGDPTNVLFPAAVAAAAVLLATRSARDWKGKRVLLPPLFLLVMALLTPLSSHLPNIHLFFLYPFPCLVLAAAVVFLHDRFAARSVRAGILLLFLLPLAYKEARGLNIHYAQLRATGGAREFSDAIHELAAWLRGNAPPGSRVFFLWGGQEFRRHLAFILPDVPLEYEFIEGFTPRTMLDDFDKRVAAAGEAPAFFVRHHFGVLRQGFHPLVEWGRRNGVEFGLAAVFQDEDGAAVFEVYRLRKIRPDFS